MSTADLFVEAVDAAIRLGWALAGWLVFLATVAAILLLAAIATGAWAVDTVLDRLCGRREASDAPEAEPEPDDGPKPPHGRRRPTWAHEQPTTYEEAA